VPQAHRLYVEFAKEADRLLSQAPLDYRPLSQRQSLTARHLSDRIYTLALLYRLNGDENPLHADPQRATVAGFDRPILHGAASFGIAAHAVLRSVADYQPERLASFEARFSKPVFPGETIRTEMWQERERVSFQCRVVGRNDIVLSNGLATLRAA